MTVTLRKLTVDRSYLYLSNNSWKPSANDAPQPTSSHSTNRIKTSRVNGFDSPAYFLIDPEIPGPPQCRTIWVWQRRNDIDREVTTAESTKKDLSWTNELALACKASLSLSLASGLPSASLNLDANAHAKVSSAVATNEEKSQKFTLTKGMVEWSRVDQLYQSRANPADATKPIEHEIADKALCSVWLSERTCPGPNGNTLVRIDGKIMTWDEYYKTLKSRTDLSSSVPKREGAPDPEASAFDDPFAKNGFEIVLDGKVEPIEKLRAEV